ncbi:hypothetical protein TYRP_022622 [Tyrophagus putrescentiae]|nr:hypothetical protein TYRP_022622 [Tyrophagus putrescentiae]
MRADLRRSRLLHLCILLRRPLLVLALLLLRQNLPLRADDAANVAKGAVRIGLHHRLANLAGKDDIASHQPFGCRLHHLRHHIRVLLQHQRPPEEVHLILDHPVVLADKLRQPLRRQRLKALLVLQVANLADVDVLLQKLSRALHDVIGHAEHRTALADAQQRIGVLDAAEKDLLRVKGADGVGRKFRLLDEPGPVKIGVARLIGPHAVNAADEVPLLVGADVAAVADAEGARRDGELLVLSALTFRRRTEDIGPGDVENSLIIDAFSNSFTTFLHITVHAHQLLLQRLHLRRAQPRRHALILKNRGHPIHRQRHLPRDNGHIGEHLYRDSQTYTSASSKFSGRERK